METYCEVYEWVMAPTPERRGPSLKRLLYTGRLLAFSVEGEVMNSDQTEIYPIALVEVLIGERQGAIDAVHYQDIRLVPA